MDIVFMCLTLVLLSFVAVGAQKAGLKSTRIVLGTAIWLLIQGQIAQLGFFENFSTVPPRLAVVIAPAIILLALASLNRKVPEFIRRIPVYWLVGFQTFRIVMEFILFRLVEDHRLPEILTFTGANVDVLVGLTAPMAAHFAYRRQFKFVQIWNAIGFLILLNTVVHGLLAAPTVFQVYHTDPPNTLVGTFPWIWLPGFVVPLALLGHVLSFRQIRDLKRINRT